MTGHTDSLEFPIHDLILVNRSHYNRYRSEKVIQYRYECSCSFHTRWRESVAKAVIDRDDHCISGQLSII